VNERVQVQLPDSELFDDESKFGTPNSELRTPNLPGCDSILPARVALPKHETAFPP